MFDLSQPDVVSAWSTFLTFVVAAAAGIVASIQLIKSGEVSAKEVYKHYLNLAFENPELAYPRQPNKTFSEMKDDFKTQEQYLWFVSIFLLACEEILISANLKDWKRTIKPQLAWHVEYFNSKSFKKSKSSYDISLIELIDEVVNEN